MAMVGFALLVALCVIEVSGQYRGHGFSRTEYPNPIHKPLLCGREKMDVSYVCDPDLILGSQDKEASQLNGLILQIINETTCPCSAYSCENHRKGYKIGIAIVKNMVFDDASSSQDDDLDAGDARFRKIVNNLDQAKLYAHELLKSWKLGRCNEDVLIFYSKDDNVVYTATHDIARKKLTNEIIVTVAKEARRTGFSKSSFDGLWKIVNDYRVVFLGGYHHRPPRYEELRMANFGVSLSSGLTYVILMSLLMFLGISQRD